MMQAKPIPISAVEAVCGFHSDALTNPGADAKDGTHEARRRQVPNPAGVCLSIEPQGNPNELAPEFESGEQCAR